MTCKSVKTQAELDAALADRDVTCVHIESGAGVWLALSSSGSATVTASGSATVRASGSATVTAYGSATVRAYGSATVRASGSATVRAYGSATVTAYDSATVRASVSATVTAYGSATVRAYGSATVTASGSATVRAYDSATVRAYDSATVRAYDSATVRAGTHVAVHLHSAQATVTGGVLIDLTKLDLTDPATWCDHHGVPVADGKAVLHKALPDNLSAGSHYNQPTVYTIGTEVACGDWADNNWCGGGLHFSPLPEQASYYADDATRWLAVEVDVTDLRPILGDVAKAKAPRCRVLREVDEHGRDLTPATT